MSNLGSALHMPQAPCGGAILGPFPKPVDNKLISKKNQPFPVTPLIEEYLETHNRSVATAAHEDLLRFEGSVAILDEDGRDTLWVDGLYSNADRDELVLNLKRVYQNHSAFAK